MAGLGSWQDLLGEYGIELIAWAHTDKWREEHKEMLRKPKTNRYCVPCLKEDRKTPAVTVIDSAGFCEFHSEGKNAPGASPRHYTKLSKEQRAEILTRHKVPAEALGRIYGVSGQTIRNIRMEAELAGVPTPGILSEALKQSQNPATGEPPTVAEMLAQVYQAPDLTEPEPEPVKMTIELAVTHEQADRVWQSLDLDVKARMVAAIVAERWAGLL